jgi:uncharacterized alpha-E superfamily protein
VLANLERLVIKPLHPRMGFRMIFGRDLNAAQRAELTARIRARPYLYVGQEPLAMATAPVLVDGGVQPRRSVLRSFLVAGEDAYHAMPGGLARVAADAGQREVSNQAGGASKDTWVLATEPEPHTSLWLEGRQPHHVFSGSGELPGRVADNLYWLGRYAERAEFTGRLLRLTLQFLLSGEREDADCLGLLLAALNRQAPPTADVANSAAAHDEQNLLSLMREDTRPGSLAQTLAALLPAARSVRDRLSGDTWRVINDIDERLRALQNLDAAQLGDARDEMDSLLQACTAFAGLTQENMTRGRGWLFLDMGRRIERALLSARLLRSLLVPVSDAVLEPVLLEALLSVFDSLMSYRRRYRHGPRVASLLELLACDERNPRALAYQLSRLEAHIGELPREQAQGVRGELTRLGLESATLVRLADVQRLAEAADDSPRRELLDQFLEVLGTRLATLSDVLSATYFHGVETPHQLLRPWTREAS